ncbi:MAG: amino acid adenylation domain-containing protein [Leptolyngbyaceae bacterium]|nr:amino acid adenylation domain-containing protein [Leptolyngbyaceae bacterium]
MILENSVGLAGVLEDFIPSQNDSLAPVVRAGLPEGITAVHQWFEAQVQQTPEAIALLWDDPSTDPAITIQHLTYGQLNQQANQLAHSLQALGVGPGSLVGLCVERSPAMVVGILAILKVGGGYVPLDPGIPTDRLNFVLEETAVKLVLTQDELGGRFAQSGVQTVALDQPWASVESNLTENLNQSIDPESVMYVIYTSGSTGSPKGVMVPHRGILNQLQWRHLTFPLAGSDPVLQNISFTFDPSVWQIFWPLTCGAPVVLPKPGGQKDIHYLMELIAQQQVSVIALVPSLLQVLLQQPELGRLATLKHVFCGGEALPGELQSLFFQQFSSFDNPPKLHNVYGPTEASIDASSWTCESDRIEPIAPIGRPILNASLYILDDLLQPVPDGEIGELYIGGAGLALGYLNRPELTAERFITRAFADSAPQPIYKTGDLVRWLSDGLLAFVGRVDQQVKVRGFRIELGDIESTLRQHPLVANAAVLVRDAGMEKQLIAYITGGNPDSHQGDHRTDIMDLREFVKAKLPDYMVPSQCIWLDTMPLNPNGKIDRRALQSLQVDPVAKTGLSLPRNQLESSLVKIWSELLKVDIGIDDNFFDVGGQSLLAIELCRRMGEVLGQTIVPAQLFAAPTVATFADQFQNDGVVKLPSLTLSRPDGNKLPFFFVNSQASLRQLLPHLDVDQPVYGLNIFGLTQRYHRNLEAVTVEAIASDMVTDILTIQPTGPYQLIAYCGDSRLTLEIAQQMQRQGHEIQLLLFIDAIWDEKTPSVAAHWQNLRRLGLGYLGVKVLRVAEALKIKMVHYSRIMKRFYQQQVTQEDLDINFLERFIHLSHQYQGEAYPGKIVLLLSCEWMPLNTPKLGEMARGGVDLHEIPGYHHTLFEVGYVEKLAERITDCLQSATTA